MKKDITKHTGDNLGGVHSFKYCFTEDVANIPPVIEGAIPRQVTMKANTRWYNGYGTEETMDFSDIQKGSGHGSYHDKEFNSSVPKDRADLVDLFNSLADQRFILDITYNNGCRKLVGTVEEPMRLICGQRTNKKVAEKNGYSLQFTGQGIKKSPFYTI